ncbi:phage holin family protein, partial [Micromonospora zhanjiangensis]
AFAMLADLLAAAAVALALFARRQIRRPAPPPGIRFAGVKLATAGLVCGAVGLGGTALAMGLALLLQLG